MAAYRYGFTVTSTRYIGPNTMRVTFTSTWTDKLYQLYLNDQLVAWTEAVGDRAIQAQVKYNGGPGTVRVVAVDVADQQTDYFGTAFQDGADHQALASWNATGFPADASHFNAAVGEPAAGNINWDEPINAAPIYYTTPGAIYTAQSGLLYNGTWYVGVESFDTSGNRDTIARTTQSVVIAGVPRAAWKPDDNNSVEGDVASVTFVGGTLTITFSPSPDF